MEIVTLPIAQIKPYERNPRKNDDAVPALMESIKQCGYRARIIVDENNVVLCGHTRLKAIKKLGWKQVEVQRETDLTEEQKRKYRLLDNKTGELSDWDFDLLVDELDGLDFGELELDWGIEGEDWFDRQEKDGKAREDGNDEYNDFVEKFELKKTTDDCYTPEEVYDAVADWVANEYKLNHSTFCRPFYPGGDYQAFNYSGKVVVDNPPFSIITEIQRFYIERGIKFFLFAPMLTLFSGNTGAAYIPSGVNITYENGANIATSFVTNLEPGDIIVRTAPNLYQAVKEANERANANGSAELPNYKYPDYVITSAMVARWCKYGVSYTLKKQDCTFIRELDAQKAEGKVIFGSGFLLSEKAAAERAAAERAAAEKAQARKWELSEREKEIVRGLG